MEQEAKEKKKQLSKKKKLNTSEHRSPEPRKKEVRYESSTTRVAGSSERRVASKEPKPTSLAKRAVNTSTIKHESKVSFDTLKQSGS